MKLDTANTHTQPWLALYSSQSVPTDTSAPDLLALFRRALDMGAERPALHYFDQAMSYGELNTLSDRLAACLAESGFQQGDRLGLYLQNTPEFLIASLAVWKLGGIAVPFNPMLRSSELGKLLPDCMPSAIVCLDEVALHLREAIGKIEAYSPVIYLTSSKDYQTRNDARVLNLEVLVAPEANEQVFAEALANVKTQRLDFEPSLHSSDPAYIVYTSGTTGVPKGAIMTHDNIAWNALTMASWLNLSTECGPVLGLAPFFHITGIVGGMALSWQLGKACVLSFRFHPDVVLEGLLEHRPGFCVGTITAYNALMSAPNSTKQHYRSFEQLISGGAPTPPTLLQAFAEHTGIQLLNGYGLTETTAGVTTVPVGVEAPVDRDSGALSVGVPIYGADIWIAGENSQRLPANEVGEVVVCGRSVCAGYWNKAKETAESMRPDGFRSGDMGVMDEHGWVYLVDRKKDMISASGYKVWPREVEDVIYQHEAIHEAAVVGIADDYRGETVRAVVSLKPNATLDVEEFIAWCRERMAAYKAPRQVLIIDNLPKTPTGKILRRVLKD